MKTFYTVRDIEDMHAAGVTQIETHDDVVVTDVAREKAIALGIRLVPVEGAAVSLPGPVSSPMVAAGSTTTGPSAASVQPPRTGTAAAADDLVRKVKAAVIARLGTDKYNDVLDKIIPQVMAQLKK